MSTSKITPFLLILLSTFLLAGCEIIGGIFELGFYTGIFIVVLVIVILAVIIFRILKR